MTVAVNNLRVIFAGTPEFAAHHLQVLIDAAQQYSLTIVGVYTQPDRPAGRGKKISSSAVKKLAQAHQLPIFQPASLKVESAQDELQRLNADVMVVVAYGLILPTIILTTPTYGCLNVHGSLLPRWRGAAPLQRAILGDQATADGDRQTGVTIMQMDAGLDTGAMLLAAPCDIELTETTQSLHDKLMLLGGKALLEVIAQLKKGALVAVAQNNNRASYAEKITKQEAHINWSLSAKHIEKNIRAYNPFPIAYAFFDQQRIKIYSATYTETLSTSDITYNGFAVRVDGEVIALNDSGLIVACGVGALQITRLQLPGKKVMSVAELINGYQDFFSIGENFE
ncbi:MAG: methionyl-tRNA formyltransferase [Pseudohongiellaceae bacterium]|jgi:methionyl-tRNA formyltransferase